MADPQTKKTVAVNAAKIGGIMAVVPLLFSAIPEPWASALACAIIVCGGIAAAVPAPPVGSKWMLPYKLVSAIGLNFGWAVNHLGARVNAPHGAVAPTNTTNPKN